MDSESDKLRSELDAAMAEVKAARQKREPEPGPIGNVINPPSQVLQELKNDALSYALLETRIEELQRKFAAKSLQYEAEVKAQERLKARVDQLMAELAAVEDRTASYQREAAVNATLAEELSETLKVAGEARAQLASALEEERRQRAKLGERAAKLEEELDHLRPELARKEEALSGALKSLEEAKRIASQEVENRSRDQQRFMTEVDQAKARAAQAAADVDKLKLLLADRESSLAATQKQAETLREAGRRALDAAADLERARRDWEVEREKLKGQLAEREAALAAVTREAESLRESGVRAREAAAELDRLRHDVQLERERIEAERERALEQAEAVRREGNEALEAAQELKSQSRLQAEQQRSALEEERKRLLAEFKAAMKEVTEFKADLTARSEKELNELRAQLETERTRLYQQIDDERARLKRELDDRIEAERQRARSDREALLRQETLKTQKAAERERLRGELLGEPAQRPEAAGDSRSQPPVAGSQPRRAQPPGAGAEAWKAEPPADPEARKPPPPSAGAQPPKAEPAPSRREPPPTPLALKRQLPPLPPTPLPASKAPAPAPKEKPETDEPDWIERSLLGALAAAGVAAACAWFFTY